MSTGQISTGQTPLTTASDVANIPLDVSLDPITPTSTWVLPPAKRYKYTPSLAKIKIPKTSPFQINSDEELQRAKTLGNDFIEGFHEKCRVRAPPLQKFEGTFPLDIWRDILDFVHLPSDLLSICRTSSIFYSISITRLYSTLTIRSPFYYGEFNAVFKDNPPPNLIPIDALLPLSKIPEKAGSQKRMRITPTKLFQKSELLSHVKDLKVRRWQGRRLLPGTELDKTDYTPSILQSRRRHPVAQKALNLKGLYRLFWLRAKPGTKMVLDDLQEVLSALMSKNMPNLEKFCYDPQYYSSTSRINGITSKLFQALKNLPRLKSLTINFSFWDPLDPSNDEAFGALVASFYKSEIDGLVGFKSLEELVVWGVGASQRFSEIETVVKDCLFLSKRGLKRLEVRLDTSFYDDLQETKSITETQDLWIWAVALWGKCFGAAESFRYARGLNNKHINFMLEFGPIKWQWKCPENFGLICKIENLTTINLTGVHSKQIVGAIKRLAKIGTPSLKVFAVECRLTQLNMFLKRFCGLNELYIFEPDVRVNNEALLVRPRRMTAQQRPKDLKSIQWILDTILKHHLRTLEILVIQEMICPPRVNCAGSAINGIGGWREFGRNLRELGVHLWGPWEDVGEFLTAFEGIRSLHLFNRHRSDVILPSGGVPLHLHTATRALTSGNRHLYNAETTALRVANLWGMDLICARKIITPGIVDRDRWIGVGPHDLECAADWKWKWKIDKAVKYVNWEDGPEFSGGKNTEIWEKGGKMWKVLREGGVLARDGY